MSRARALGERASTSELNHFATFYLLALSVVTAVLVHGLTNVSSKALGGAVNQRAAIDARSLLVWAWALGVLSLAGRDLGRYKASGLPVIDHEETR